MTIRAITMYINNFMPLSINKKYPAVFYDDRKKRKACDMVIIHSTASDSVMGTLSWFQNLANPKKSSAHYVVAKDGTIYQCVEEEDIAFHAGNSKYTINGVLRSNISYYSIGIEVVAAETSQYTTKQLEALVELTKDIMTRHKIKPEYVLRHSDISPKRKTDPYPKNMDWEWFKSQIIVPMELPPIPPPHWGAEAEQWFVDNKYTTQKKDLDAPLTRGEYYVIQRRIMTSKPL